MSHTRPNPFGAPRSPSDPATAMGRVQQRITADREAEQEALELAESIISPSNTPEPEPEPKPVPESADGDDWHRKLTDVDLLVDEPATVEIPNPLVFVEGRDRIEAYLKWMVDNDGSDLHIVADEEPRVRIHGRLRRIPGVGPLTGDEVMGLIAEVLTEKQIKLFGERRDMDAAYAMSVEDGAALDSRFRTNVAVSMGKFTIVMRVIPTRIRTLDELGVLPQIKELAKLPRGLVLITGPTGSGKSTTLAAIVDLMNTTREERIWTFEDPVEFTHQSKKCMVSHREVGTDTESFASGLRAVRREDPDIILIGEMRDPETIRAAIEAADSGHYVLGTLHTSSAYETVGRIINTFPEEEQNQIRVTLASILRAVVCQTLIPAPKSDMGRVVATEIMMVTAGIANNIRENDLPAIRNALSDTSAGSISLDAHLAQLINQGAITKKEALKKATSDENLERQLGQKD